MKKVILSIVLLVLFENVSAQFGRGGILDINRLKQTTTKVVLEGNEIERNALKNAFEKYWTFTPVEFITPVQYEMRCAEQRVSYARRYTSFGLEFPNGELENIGIILGGNCRTKANKMIAYANLLELEGEDPNAQAIRSVQMLQWYLQLAEEHEVDKENKPKMLLLYEDEKRLFLRNTLNFLPEHLKKEVQTAKKAEKYHGKAINIVSQSDIDHMILDQTKGQAYYFRAYDLEGNVYHLGIQARKGMIQSVLLGNGKGKQLVGKKVMKFFGSR